MARFSPLKLLVMVTCAGLAYAAWYALGWKGQELDRAHACRANQNLIDRYIGFWEAKNGYLDATRGTLFVEIDTAGAITRTSPGCPLVAGSHGIADAARDPEAFACPEAGALPGVAASPPVHYRWVMGREPLGEVNGRMRGTVCLLHGHKGPSDDPRARHIW
jgi:hypothetical protein